LGVTGDDEEYDISLAVDNFRGLRSTLPLEGGGADDVDAANKLLGACGDENGVVVAVVVVDFTEGLWLRIAA
jgi:hypothetical protein